MNKNCLILLFLSIVFYGCEKELENEFGIEFLSDNTIEMKISMQTPGTLGDYINSNDKKRISILRIAGALNGDDIQTIRDIMDYQQTILGTRLFKVLDLSGCDFEAGGSFLFPGIIHDHKGLMRAEIVFDSVRVSPDKSHSIPPYAFANVHLQSIILSTSITSIGDYSFMYNDIRGFSIPSSVNVIGKAAFYSTFIHDSILIPEGVTILPDSVFYDASQLSSIILPSTIQSLGKKCLGNCLHLSKITVKCLEPPICDDTMWDDWYLGIRSLYVPKNSIEKYRNHPVWGMADLIKEIN